MDGGWEPDGPVLPVEFARQSNDNRITLVITSNAPRVTTLWATLAVESLANAKAVLAVREGISDANIGRRIGTWSADVEERANHGIGEWARGKGFAHVVGTALKPKIGTEYSTPAVADVLTHLGALTGHDLDRAEEYRPLLRWTNLVLNEKLMWKVWKFDLTVRLQQTALFHRFAGFGND